MNYPAIIRSSLSEIVRNRARSALVILGCSVGIAAVICVVAISNGAQTRIRNQIESLGDNLVWIEAGSSVVNGVRTGIHASPTLTLDDAIAILDQVHHVSSVSPHLGGQTQVIFGDRNWFTRYEGVGPEYFDIKRWRLEDGAFFLREDVKQAANVCVLGRTVRDQLFGGDSAIGRVIRLGELPCTVIGTLAVKGLSLSGQDQDDTVILPVTTVQTKLRGVAWIEDILASATTPQGIEPARIEAAAVLRDRHRLRPGQTDDFTIIDPQGLIQAQIESARLLTILLLCVASISLLVGGIGIMNMMLISVTERTREIGIRIAVGATERAIKLQFLSESVALSISGGIAGIALGIAGSTLIGRSLGWPLDLSLKAIAVASLFSVAIGIFFGFYPARKAAQLNPIDALRFE